MKRARDFRQIARNVLRGKWLVAVLTGFIASLLGGGIFSGGGSVSSSGDASSVSLPQNLPTDELSMQLGAILAVVGIIAVIWAIATIIIGGAAKLGYAVFNLKLVDEEDAAFSDLFSQFHRLGSGFCMNFLTALFTLLWSLLLIIPGIIKAFSYAMTPYVLAENPGMRARDAITESRRIMNGNKWRLFCLGFSFIGWDLLCSVPILISLAVATGSVMANNSLSGLWSMIPLGLLSFAGFLFLRPYVEAAHAAFYREISAQPVSAEQV